MGLKKTPLLNSDGKWMGFWEVEGIKALLPSRKPPDLWRDCLLRKSHSNLKNQPSRFSLVNQASLTRKATNCLKPRAPPSYKVELRQWNFKTLRNSIFFQELEKASLRQIFLLTKQGRHLETWWLVWQLLLPNIQDKLVPDLRKEELMKQATSYLIFRLEIKALPIWYLKAVFKETTEWSTEHLLPLLTRLKQWRKWKKWAHGKPLKRAENWWKMWECYNTGTCLLRRCRPLQCLRQGPNGTRERPWGSSRRKNKTSSMTHRRCHQKVEKTEQGREESRWRRSWRTQASDRRATL